MFTTRLKEFANQLLRPVNLRIETRTADRVESDRLGDLDDEQWFASPAFPIPDAIARSNPEPLFEVVEKYASDLARLLDARANSVSYDPNNPYFASPDAEILYAIVRSRRPRRMVEVGSGYSTRVARQAIRDGGLETEIFSIDPCPRIDVQGMVDVTIRDRVEHVELEVLSLFRPGDILFVDSSHEVRPGNDVIRLLLRMLPRLPEGILVQVHDIFLPWDYPREWVVVHRRPWSEQYLLQALLMGHPPLEVIWAGHWVQKSRVAFAEAFPAVDGREAKSFWFRNGKWPESA